VKPTLPQAKANKCLIALVAKKLVTKSSVGVSGVRSNQIQADIKRERHSTFGPREESAAQLPSA